MTSVKSAMAAFGITESHPSPAFTAINIPLGGYGMELAFFLFQDQQLPRHERAA